MAIEEQKYPLTNEQIRRKRLQRDKQLLLVEMGKLAYERDELRAELRKAQEIYIRRLDKAIAGMDSILVRQRKLEWKVKRAIQEDGRCSASTQVLGGHKDKTHVLHMCEEPFEHEARHKCACGAHFRETAEEQP